MIFKPTRLLPIFYILSTNTVLSFTFIIFHLSQAFALSKNYIRSDELYYGKTEQQGSSINNKIIIPFYPFQHALTREADSLFLSYENEAALEKYKSAHAYFRKTGNWEGVGYTGNMIAEIFTYRLYKYDLAESYLKQTERYIKENLGDDHPLLADTYMAYGTLFNQMGGHALQEEDYLNKSLKLKSNHYGLKSIQIAELNYRIGQLYQHSLSQFDLAKEYYKRALTVFKEFLPSNHPDLIKVYFALGSIYRYMDDFQRANINLDNAIYFYSLDSISNITRIARSQIVKANVLNEIKEYNISLINYASAIKIIENKNGSNDTDLIRAYLGLGVAHLRLGNINEAILDFNRSIKILNINFSNIDQYSIVIYPYLLLNKGMCFSKLQDRDSARFCLFRALELRERYFKDDRKDLALAYEYIADMYDNFSQYDSAMYYAQTALVKLIPEFNSMDYQQNPEIVNDENMTRLIDIFALKAKILMNKSKFDTQNTQSLLEALHLYHKLDQLSDNIKNSAFAEESILILTSDIHQIYSQAISCAFQLYQITEDIQYINDALRFFEKNKYMLLFQNLELARKSNELNIPFEYRFEEDSIKMLLAEITQKIDDNDQQSVSKLSTERVELDNALTTLRTEIESKYPNYYKMEFDNLTVNLNQLKDYAVKNNDLLIEYYVGDSNIFIIGVGPENVTFHEIKRSMELNQNLNNFLTSISKGQLEGNIQESYNVYNKSAYFIFEHLFSPVIEHRALNDDARIIVCPDGLLAQVPFEALTSELPDSNYPDYTRLKYLIYKYDISYVYSFNLFFNEGNVNPVDQNNILAFSYSGSDVSNNPKERSQDILELTGTTREIESIRKIVRGKNLFLEDEEATETQFKNRSKDFQILHLALHGKGNYESSINSELIFKNQLDSLNDGNLYIYEIYNLDLSHSKLAILSACETGIGKEFKGEGVFSIARGFASAGCPSIIMSLWNVNDMVSADIMAEFYRNLKRGKTINNSLRESKIAYIENADQLQAHPGNWAAFVPLGQMYAIYNKQINLLMIGIILLVMIPIIIYFYLRVFKK